jgi:Flp pilus assembly protein TadG
MAGRSTKTPAACGLPAIIGKFKLFAKNETGVITIEFVMWMPAFSFMLAFIVDFSFIFMTNASMWDTARDAARRIALQKMTVDQTEKYVLASLFTPSSNFSVEATEGAEEVTVTITTPINDATAFRIYAAMLPGNLVAHVIMLREPE